jgi:hypothetical protein
MVVYDPSLGGQSENNIRGKDHPSGPVHYAEQRTQTMHVYRLVSSTKAIYHNSYYHSPPGRLTISCHLSSFVTTTLLKNRLSSIIKVNRMTRPKRVRESSSDFTSFQSVLNIYG